MRSSLSFGAALIGASLLAGLATTPVSAAPLAGAMSKGISGETGSYSLPPYVQLVQGGPRIGPRHGGRGGYRGGYRGGGYRGGGHYRRGHDGDWAGGAAAGAALGLFLGAIIATEAQRQDAVGYCMRRYRSYDPQSMTYLGYDGLRHPCP